MINIIKIIFRNFRFIDFFIIVLLVVNILIFLIVKEKAESMHNVLYPKDYSKNMPDRVKNDLLKAEQIEEKKFDINELFSLREHMNSLYAYYTGITSVFPLLGMFGTVVSLIPMVDKMGEQSTGLFFTALTSTFWGILSAIICKILDAGISPTIEDDELYIETVYIPDKVHKER